MNQEKKENQKNQREHGISEKNSSKHDWHYINATKQNQSKEYNYFIASKINATIQAKVIQKNEHIRKAVLAVPQFSLLVAVNTCFCTGVAVSVDTELLAREYMSPTAARRDMDFSRIFLDKISDFCRSNLSESQYCTSSFVFVVTIQ